MAECFPSEHGLLFFEPFWNETEDGSGIHWIDGHVTGSGPWKIAGYVIGLLGCAGSDGELRLEYEEWISHRSIPGYIYPDATRLAEIAAECMRELEVLQGK